MAKFRDVSYFGWEVLASGEDVKLLSSYNDVHYDEAREKLYVCGQSRAQTAWFVGKSIDDGESWTRIDYLSGAESGEYGTLEHAHAKSIFVDSSGSIYVAGVVKESGGNELWTVRKSTTGDSGSFVTIDSYNVSASDADPDRIFIDHNDNIYVGGRQEDAHRFGILRRSTTGASGSFVTVDSLSSSDGTTSINVDSARKCLLVFYSDTAIQ